LIVECEGKRPLGRPKYRWEDNIRIDLKGIGLGLDSSGSAQRPVPGSCEYNEPLGS